MDRHPLHDTEVLQTLGIIGSGNVGSAIARLAVAANIRVVVSNSRGPETLTDLVQELGPLASAGTVEDAAAAPQTPWSSQCLCPPR